MSQSLQSFDDHLQSRKTEHEQQLQSDLDALFGNPKQDPTGVAIPFGSTVQPLINARVDLTGDAGLRSVDDLFVETFQLRQHLANINLFYPTVYAETLDEFFAPLGEEMDLSPEAKAAVLNNLQADAERTARETRGGIFGVNLPGRGCLLNGWLFAYGRGYAPRNALTDSQVLSRILATLAHEKLGHGFITEFTALGAEKKRVGLARLDLAKCFDVRAMDSPAATLLAQKHALVHTVSQLTEEGWATWVEHFLMPRLVGAEPRPPHTLDAILRALDQLASDKSTREMAAQIRQALNVLFIAPSPALDDLHRAIIALHQTAPLLEDFFFRAIGQPLPYAVGYLLIEKLAANLGWLCAPYAMMIAANLQYDLDKTSVSDLERLVVTNPRLNVDSRLAMLGAIKLETPNDVGALTQVASAMSIAVPTSWQV